MSRIGSPAARRIVRIPVVSVTSPSAPPPSTVSRPSGVSAILLTTRKSPSPPATGTRIECPPGGIGRGSGRPARLAVEATTRPCGSSTWTSCSSPIPLVSATGSVPAATAAATAPAWDSAPARTSVTRACRSATTSPIAPTSSARPTTTTAPVVVRTRTLPPKRGRRLAAIGGQPVAQTTYGFDRRAAVRAVELVAQVSDVDLDDVWIALEVVRPHVREDLALGHHLAAAPKQELEQRELPGGEVKLIGAAPDLFGRRVEPQVTGRQHRRSLGCAATQQRAQSSDQHRERERLDQVVVRAGIQRLDLVPFAVLRGQHENRGPDPLGAQGLTDLVAVEARQHDVQNDHVVRILPSQPEPIDPVAGYIDGEALGCQAPPQAGGQSRLVLDDEHSHDPAPYPIRRSRSAAPLLRGCPAHAEV